MQARARARIAAPIGDAGGVYLLVLARALASAMRPGGAAAAVYPSSRSPARGRASTPRDAPLAAGSCCCGASSSWSLR
jgi:hypothetical protein